MARARCLACGAILDTGAAAGMARLVEAHGRTGCRVFGIVMLAEPAEATRPRPL